MKTEEQSMRRRIRLTLILLPLLIASFVVGGVFTGFYVSDLLGYPRSIVLPLIFSTAGLAVSMLLSYVIAKRVAATRSSSNQGRD